MRLLGPRSISSLLKTAIDVVYYGLYSLIFVVVVAAVCLLSVPNLASEAVRRFHIAGDMTAGSLAVMFVAFGLSLAGYLVIMHWTRKIFQTLAEGDVFHPDNTIRLRWIGFGLGAMEIFSYVVRAGASGIFHVQFEPIYGLRAVTTWFAVLVVFVLAEVFKEGARLRQEVDHTI